MSLNPTNNGSLLSLSLHFAASRVVDRRSIIYRIRRRTNRNTSWIPHLAGVFAVHIYLRSWRVLARVYARHVACVDSPRPIDTPLLRPCKDIHEAAIKHLPTRCVCTSILILSAISFAYAFVHTIAYRPSWPHIANMYEPGRLFLARFENRPLVTTLASYSPEIPCFGNRYGSPQFTFHYFTDNLYHNVNALYFKNNFISL